MRRGTTPTLTLTVNMDITDYVVYVTIAKGTKEIELTNDALTMSYAGGKTTIEFSLTQEQTLSFSEGSCEVQVRALRNGTAIATDIQSLQVERILKNGVISDE